MRAPEPIWAVALAALGVLLALSVLFAVLAIASNLVAGALGAFAGRASVKSESISTK
jgi:hypothetical protein